MPSDKRGLTYSEKLRQANREAKAALVALACVVGVWIVGGFGLAAVDMEVFGTPVWVIGGTIGTWIAAIVAAVVLGRRVFADCDLDDCDSLDDGSSPASSTVPAGVGGFAAAVAISGASAYAASHRARALRDAKECRCESGASVATAVAGEDAVLDAALSAAGADTVPGEAVAPDNAEARHE